MTAATYTPPPPGGGDGSQGQMKSREGRPIVSFQCLCSTLGFRDFLETCQGSVSLPCCGQKSMSGTHFKFLTLDTIGSSLRNAGCMQSRWAALPTGFPKLLPSHYLPPVPYNSVPHALLEDNPWGGSSTSWELLL